MSDNKSQALVDSASWMDDIKTPGMDYYNEWHYFDHPVNDDGLLLQIDNSSMLFNSVNTLQRAL